MAVVDSVVNVMSAKVIDQATLDRAIVKFRSFFYGTIGDLGLGRADLLAAFSLFDDDPSRINSIEKRIREVTPELLQRTAREYLRPTNQTVLAVVPKSR